ACRAHYPGGPSRCLSVSSRLVQPSPVYRRVGIHIFTFEACSNFTRVTACRIACPPKSGLLSRGFDPTSCPTGPLSSFHVYRQLHGWIPPPQVIFAVSAHCKRMGNMCESRPGSHSVFSNMRAPESDGHRLSACNSNQMHVQPTPHLFLALFTAKIYQLLTLLTAGQFTAHDVLRAFMPTRARFAACKHFTQPPSSLRACAFRLP